ncbi:uncharacterized protein LOC100280332 [Zea mays]|uniref:DUF1618 domain-containing protein n=2 Tax=Zea mays TaxID=4577 RepID=B8A388_MAIZE|nr:uncharacterized protein LOC100280332 [Zea mays]ACL54637.1 unknown [Zea mays]AQK84715.1 hypothetical protein ZEAMMB73_Zm00001d037742 [Zea mays]|eukprot:NP_001146730.1 uncharacterized protein LOC100280332 [Zea mays]
MSAPEVEEPSRARQEAKQEPESKPLRKWVALVSSVVLLGNENERDQEIAVNDVLLDINDPPLPSYLVLRQRHRVGPDPRRNHEPRSAYILAADRSACILLQVVEGNRRDLFLCDTYKRAVTILPRVSYIQACKGHGISPHRSIGLIADPHHRGHYEVVQLHSSTSGSDNQPNRLLCYSTATRGWFTRGLTLQQSRMRKPFSETGVLAHDGRLWWLALAYGVFFCNPCTPLFEPRPAQLHFLPLPADCVLDVYVPFDPLVKTLIDQRRCVRPSEGKLRFVEIRGLSYNEFVDVAPTNPTVWMWTLDDPEGPNPWTFEYEVAFAEIWDDTYADAGLLPSKVPRVALVDPNDHYVVYFFQGSKLFGLDARDKKIVACKECLIERNQQMFPSSRPIIDAWELPGDVATMTLHETIMFGRHSLYSEEKKREVMESIDYCLEQARLEWARDADTSDESSVNTSGQADDEPEI